MRLEHFPQDSKWDLIATELNLAPWLHKSQNAQHSAAKITRSHDARVQPHALRKAGLRPGEICFHAI